MKIQERIENLKLRYNKKDVKLKVYIKIYRWFKMSLKF